MKKKLENGDYVEYAYGYESENLDGILRVYTNGNGEIVKETQDERVGRMGTLKALAKLIRLMRDKKELSEIEVYQS